MRVLVAEENVTLRSVLKRCLLETGNVVDAVGDGELALHFLRTYDFDVVVLDWPSATMSTIEVIHQLRREGSSIPILLISARHIPDDRVAGLDAGADDYLVKPFDFGELLARIRALRRRSIGAPGQGVDSLTSVPTKPAQGNSQQALSRRQ